MPRTTILFLFTLLYLISSRCSTAQEPNSYEFLIGDFNGDGRDDFVRRKTGGWATDGEDTVEVFYANDNRTFIKSVLNPEFDLGSDVTNWYIGDFNGDGKDDILRQEKGARVAYDVIRNATNTSCVILSTGQDFSIIVLSEGLYLNGDFTNLYIGDYNGDGIDDILKIVKGPMITYGYKENMPLLIKGTPDGLFDDIKADYFPEPSKSDFDTNLTNIYIGDFDGDNKDDIFRQEKGRWAVDRYNTAYVLSLTTYSFEKGDLPEYFDLNGDYTTLNFGDFNGDGKDDVIRRDNRTGSGNTGAYILLSLGNNQFYAAVLPESLGIVGNNTNILIADFNGDGTADLLRQSKGDVSNHGNMTVQTFISTGYEFVEFSYSTSAKMNGDVSKLLIGDFDGDRNDDILQYWELDNIWVHYSGGKGNFDSHEIVLT